MIVTGKEGKGMGGEKRLLGKKEDKEVQCNGEDKVVKKMKGVQTDDDKPKQHYKSTEASTGTEPSPLKKEEPLNIKNKKSPSKKKALPIKL